jgi:phospholipase/lecithinase/hemolysin
LIPPYVPTVLSIVNQVGQFNRYLKTKPVGAEWKSSDSLFVVWIGINDVGNSFSWTNVSFPAFFDTVLDRLQTQVHSLYGNGARSFLLLTVPPTDRAPLWLQQGAKISRLVKVRNAQFNSLLKRMAARFEDSHASSSVRVFDTQPLFNALLDNADAFNFFNSTGWCAAYENGTPSRTTQTLPCAPVSSYFWLNSLHPLYVVHNMLAHAISTFLSV